MLALWYMLTLCRIDEEFSAVGIKALPLSESASRAGYFPAWFVHATLFQTGAEPHRRELKDSVGEWQNR